MDENNISQLPLASVKTDSDLAREYRSRIGEAIQPVMDIMMEAKRAGFDCQFGIAWDATGRPHLAQLQIVRVFS